MSSPASILATIVLALGAVEATAYWWMHPAPAGLGQPVLVYQPSRSAGVSPASEKTASGVIPSTLNPPPSTSSTLTPLPDIYQQAAPMLRCSTGQVFHAQLDDILDLHLAFFEWNDTDAGSVLEAFRHVPEACMGSIGMTLVSKEKPLSYPIGGESLVFDHTVFREPTARGGRSASGSLVHAFRAVWVGGMDVTEARQEIRGTDVDPLRTIRLKCAISRSRPSHARVIQGAVRGAANGETAWQAFEETMLKDLKFQ